MSNLFFLNFGLCVLKILALVNPRLSYNTHLYFSISACVYWLKIWWILDKATILTWCSKRRCVPTVNGQLYLCVYFYTKLITGCAEHWSIVDKLAPGLLQRDRSCNRSWGPNNCLMISSITDNEDPIRVPMKLFGHDGYEWAKRTKLIPINIHI